MWSRVYVTTGCSVRMSVSSCSTFAAVGPAGRRYRSILPPAPERSNGRAASILSSEEDRRRLVTNVLEYFLESITTFLPRYQSASGVLKHVAPSSVLRFDWALHLFLCLVYYNVSKLLWFILLYLLSLFSNKVAR